MIIIDNQDKNDTHNEVQFKILNKINKYIIGRLVIVVNDVMWQCCTKIS